MQWSDIQFSPTQRTLRSFCGLGALFFGGIATWQGLVRGNASVAIALGVIAVAFGVCGLIRPAAIRPVYVAWMVVAFPIGWLVSTVLLAITYYGVFTPIGLAFRLVGRDPLRLRRRQDSNSYWIQKPGITDPRRYFQQF